MHGHVVCGLKISDATHNQNRRKQHMRIRFIAPMLLAATALSAASLVATAQQAPAPVTAGASTIKRTILQKFDVPGTTNETVIGKAEIMANSMIGKHTHFGVEGGFVLEGELVLMIAGQPDKALKAGESYQIPAGAAHDGKSGPNGATVIATYVVEKGKPLATPAP
jgi:quercetin dioxygenase-like cupin family protein